MRTTLRFEHSSGPEGSRSAVRVRAGGEAEIVLWIEALGVEMPPPPVWDGFVFGILLRLMAWGFPVEVEGALSREGLRNLYELQDFWVLLKPEKYRRVEILPAGIDDTAEPVNSEVICAFSGGVDGTFSLLRHAHGWLGERSRRVTAGLLVHGFDVPLEAGKAFEALRRRCLPALTEAGASLFTVRTNLKRDSGQSWEDSFAAQLSACLHLFGGRFGAGMLGSSLSYDAMYFPWGSTPVTDPMLSGACFRIHPDGSGFSRTAKVAELARNLTALRGLKFCWQGPDPSENCGVCEKCIRTRLNFLAVGVESPGCLPKEWNPESIRTIPLRNPIVLKELESVAHYAARRGIQGAWIELLDERLRAEKKRTSLQRLKTAIKEYLGEDSSVVRLRRVLRGRG